jgi:hypothetical protein
MGDPGRESVEHNIDALASLDGIYSIPNYSHDCSIEGWPPGTENTERRSIENRISTFDLISKDNLPNDLEYLTYDTLLPLFH